MKCKNCGKTFNVKYSKWSNGDFCCKKCARGFSTKNNRQEINKKISDKMKNIVMEKGENYPWNKGMSTIPIKNCPICGCEFNTRRRKQIFCSIGCMNKDVDYLFHKKRGGYRQGSGRSYGGYYNNIYCHSTYELSFVIWSIDNNIPIKQCKKVFQYLYEEKEYNYYPDFEINDVIYEIKGYWTERVEAKTKAVKNSGYEIKVLYYKDIKEYIKYAITKYEVKNINELYDNYKPDSVICQCCGKEFKKQKKSKGIFCSRICAGKALGTISAPFV